MTMTSPLTSAKRPTLSSSLAIKLVLTALFWGGTFIAGKVVAQSLPPMTAACGRFLIASICLLVIIHKVEGGLPKLKPSYVALTACLGFFGIFLYSLCFFGALARLPAGRTALFVSLSPAVTALAASLFFRERLSLVRWLGIITALLGTFIVITRGDLIGITHDLNQSFGVGEMMMGMAVVSWSTYTLISRKVMMTLSPMAATTYAILWGAIFLSLGASPEWSSIAWSAIGWHVWAALLYLGIVGTVLGFVWFYEGIKAVGPSRAAVFMNLVPIFGVLLSNILLGEPILISMIIGGIITITGIYLTNRHAK